MSKQNGLRFRYVVFLSGKEPLVYSCRVGDEEKLIKRKLSQHHHDVWLVEKISTEIFETASAARRAGKAKYRR